MRLIIVVLVCSLGLPGSAFAQSAAAAAAMTVALDQVRDDDWRAADAAAIPAGRVGRLIVEWYRLRDGDGDFDDYLDFLSVHPDWPEADRLRRTAEAEMPPGLRPEAVLDFFDGDLPRTGVGLLRLINAHIAMNHGGDAEALAVLGWRTMVLGSDVEAELADRFGTLLNDHHEARLDELLWRGQENAARRMFPRVSDGWEALAEARLALARLAPGVDARIEAVPEALADDAGLAYERFNWRIRKNRSNEALALMQERSFAPEGLGKPDRWSNWRRIYARRLMRDGDALEAYATASQHFLVEGSHFADLEWLSGFLALRYLDDPELAHFHFERFTAAVETPISLGRGYYWQGRALEEMGEPERATAAYAEGATHQTAFYGLLAAEAAGVPLDPALTGSEEFTPFDESPLAENSVLEAALLLIAGGEPWRAEQFLTHLARTLDRDTAGTLGQFLLDRGETHIAVRVGKAVARNGYVVPAAYYPLDPRVDGNLPVERALALAIARRESEFDPVVVSPAGARGMMQLMPGTASDVSRELGLSYSRDGLTEDPAYNVRLGSQYLAGLINRFGPAPILVSVGYNAGPGRALSWMRDRGDPRNGNVDLIDWIELIPFRETRNYVMRVAESVIVYRARLSGETGPVEMLDYLRNG